MDLLEEVKCDRNVPAKLHAEACPHCGRRLEEGGNCRLHSRRSRWFYVVVKRLVNRILSVIWRWKCACGKTFTDYPEYALPHKRYVRQAVVGKSARYVEEDGCTLRQAAADAERGLGVAYAALGAAKAAGGKPAIDERHLSHATVWRWTSYLGRLGGGLRWALRLIRRKDPASGIFRRVALIPGWKYRSRRRREELQTCLGLVRAATVWLKLFGKTIFPELATNSNRR